MERNKDVHDDAGYQSGAEGAIVHSISVTIEFRTRASTSNPRSVTQPARIHLNRPNVALRENSSYSSI